MRDLAAYVMEDMGLGDTVGSMGTDPGHDASEVTEEVAVHGGKSTAGESELASAVVGKKRVGVLEEGDEDEPVIDPEEGQSAKCRSTMQSTHQR